MVCLIILVSFLSHKTGSGLIDCVAQCAWSYLAQPSRKSDVTFESQSQGTGVMREESSAEHKIKRSDNILIPPVISKAADDNKI